VDFTNKIIFLNFDLSIYLKIIIIIIIIIIIMIIIIIIIIIKHFYMNK